MLNDQQEAADAFINSRAFNEEGRWPVIEKRDGGPAAGSGAYFHTMMFKQVVRCSRMASANAPKQIDDGRFTECPVRLMKRGRLGHSQI